MFRTVNPQVPGSSPGLVAILPYYEPYQIRFGSRVFWHGIYCAFALQSIESDPLLSHKTAKKGLNILC